MYMNAIQFDKLQSKYSPSYRLPNDEVARVSELHNHTVWLYAVFVLLQKAIDLINTTIEYN